MMATVDELSAPNEKLTKLNQVFEEITTLDQSQRAEAIENPEKPYKYFLDQSGFLHLMIDSLEMLPWDTVQLKRLESLHTILDNRNELFVSYLKVKAELANNREFSSQLDTLSILLRENQFRADSSVITTERKTITHYLNDSAQAAKTDKGFFKRLFSKRKPKNQTPKTAPTAVQEELKVKVDTLAIARQGANMDEIHKIIKDLEKDQRSQRAKLQQKELELINANSLFINQLLNTLHEVQNEELQIMRASNDHASQVVNEGISRINFLVIVFFLGGAFLVFLILIDISRSNFYKKQLEKARDQAEELSMIKQRFLANMSHEIRTPLQSIIGFAEQLKKGGAGNKESVDAIYSSSEHLLQIVNEVLDYSRISSGTFTLASEPFQLLQLVREVESAMRIQAQQKGLTLVLETNDVQDISLTGDSFRLRQILYNLIGNSIKFTFRGFVRLSIKTFEQDDKVKVQFEIADSGIGMTDEEVKKIFNQFEQANPDISKKYGGTGLGLTIVKALVDVQHGDIQVTSEPGAGSTFTIKLQFAKAAVQQQTVTQTKLSDISTFNSKVIVVDDDAMILKLCSLILKKNKISHKTYSDVDELIAQRADPAVSHFFVDIRMPKINGVQLCSILKPKYGQHAKFIALTAHVLPEERQNLLTEGFDLVLTKPFHEAALLEALGLSHSDAISSNLPDFKQVRQMTMGDEALFQSVMQQFVAESESDLARLETVMQSDKKVTREIIHRLAGRFGQIGIYDLSAIFHDIEVGLVKGKELHELKPEIETAVKDAMLVLRAIRINTLANVA